MNHKVLLADDSLTIQKVIKITLANQPYDITDCSNEDELFQKLPIVQPRIVLLDFNLSERYTGYELTSKIHSICPGAKILLLLGTFDTVDESALEKCGASDKIVKPFDSNKFIKICGQLIDLSADFEPEVAEDSSVLPADEELQMPDSEEQNPEDQWQMNNPAAKNLEEEQSEEPITEPTSEKLDALSKEITDWGLSVPNVINDDSSHEIRFNLPPVIGEVKSLDEQRQKSEAAKQEKETEVVFPESNDLDYPTIEELEQSSTSAAESEVKPRQASQLISIDSFTDNPVEFELEGNYVEDVADVSSIEDQIKDEVEENLWQADEFEELKREVSTKIEEMKSELGPDDKNVFDESLFKPLDEGESIEWDESKSAPSASSEEPKFAASEDNHQTQVSKGDLGELRVEIEAMVKKHVQEYMDELFQKNVEKISWEVIPDLAENLIRQELSKIAHKINDQE